MILRSATARSPDQNLRAIGAAGTAAGRRRTRLPRRDQTFTVLHNDYQATPRCSLADTWVEQHHRLRQRVCRLHQLPDRRRQGDLRLEQQIGGVPGTPLSVQSGTSSPSRGCANPRMSGCRPVDVRGMPLSTVSRQTHRTRGSVVEHADRSSTLQPPRPDLGEPLACCRSRLCLPRESEVVAGRCRGGGQFFVLTGGWWRRPRCP